MSMKYAFCLLFLFSELHLRAEIDRSWSRSDAEIDASFDGAVEQRGAKSQHLAIIGWKKTVEATRNLPTQEAIPLLGNALMKMTKKNIFQIPERVEVYDRAQNLILSIPGHAELYRDKINATRQNMEDARNGDLGTFAYLRGKLHSVVRYDFPVFKELPSPETVRVMGEFLFDERGYYKMNDPMTETDIQRQDAEAPVFARAAMTLTELPIENKPVPEIRYPSYTNPEDVKPWRDWIDEIKAGKRTFRFKGDPTEYDLDGPASKEKIERIAKTRERDEKRIIGRSNPPSQPVATEGESKSHGASWMTALVLCLASLAAAGWCFVCWRNKSLPS